MPALAEASYISLITPLVAVLLALVTRQVFLSLLMGILLGQVVIAIPEHGELALVIGLRETVGVCVRVMTDPGNVRVVFFCALVGSVLLLANRAGGVVGFVNWMTRRGWGRTRRGAQLFTLIVGGVVFVETSISCLVTGAVGRPLCDKVKISREKLAFLCDSMSAPICALLLIVNAWGAYLMSLLAKTGSLGGETPTMIMLKSMPYNFYSLAIIGVALVIVLTGRDFGGMKEAERRAREEGKVLRDGARPLMSDEITSAGPDAGVNPRARHFVIPILTMLCMMPVGLILSGLEKVDFSWNVFSVMTAGSGSTAVLWAVIAALVVGVFLAKVDRIFSLAEATELIIKGAGGLASMALLMILALAIGATCKTLGTGDFVKSMLAGVPGEWLAPLIFLASCLVAFATGTSFGAMAIMVPLGIPTALASGTGIPLMTAAILSGAVFGDHCSPISDTTLMSSMASASDHIDHVRTQLPYALTAAAIALIGFFLAGLAA